MGVYEGRGQLTRAMKDLMARWAETSSVWDDIVAKNFEKRFLSPLEIDVRNATSAMDQASQLLAKIRRDCT